MLIYIQDRDYDTLKALDLFLCSSKSYTVRCFTNNNMLRNAVTKKVPDIVITESDEKNSLSEIYSLCETVAPSKIIIMSKSDRYALTATEIGAAGYLTKPVDNEKLGRILKEISHPILAKLCKNKFFSTPSYKKSPR